MNVDKVVGDTMDQKLVHMHARESSRLNDQGASQTLIVLSSDPDTILVPSGENATDLM